MATQRIYNLVRSDYNNVYAAAGIRGTYVKHPNCPYCGRQIWDRIEPLVIEWEAGASVIADFTWPCCIGERVVTQRVKDLIDQHRFTGVTFGPVSMVQGRKLKRPTRKDSRTKPRVWLPYEGPPLWDLRAFSWCNLDMKASKRKMLLENCDFCKWKIWDAPTEAPLVVDSASWDGMDFFRIHEVGDVVFVIERVWKILKSAHFTNLAMNQAGRIR
jgi:hypothetical protein